ncbi:MAG TPA: thiol peroxidase [Acholeplasma sp.]|nr:thiol peroxidase [Acholeplasma sp.]
MNMVLFKGKQVTLLGKQAKVGDQAEDFKVINNKLEEVHLKDLKEKYLVISVVPSLDTTVCDLQTRTVNEELGKFKDVLVVTISNDLPFAQARWCGASGLTNVITLSDYNFHDFGMKFGVLIDELKLLARSVFVLDSKRKIIYAEYASETSQHLDYDQLLTFIKTLPEG